MLTSGAAIAATMIVNNKKKTQHRTDSFTNLGERHGAEVHTPDGWSAPSFGIAPRNIATPVWMPDARGEFDHVLELSRANHRVLVGEFTTGRYFTWGPGRKLHYRSSSGPSAAEKEHWHMVQVQIPPTPTLSIRSRTCATKFHSDEPLTEWKLGDALFDQLFEVRTADAAFAHAVIASHIKSVLLLR
jgi:hypothetical protein